MDFVQEDLNNMEKQGAVVKEMEAAGIAWSAHLFETPFFALKSVTDIVDGGRVAQEEFLENLSAAAKALHVRRLLALSLCTAFPGDMWTW